MKVTIKDVAKEAGVAPSTVSRVLSGNDKISEETKKIVNEAIKKLKYKPNVIARSLANNKTCTLGIILPNEPDASFANPFFIQVMQGISKYVQQNHYYMMYAFYKDEKEKVEYIKEFAHNGMVDGIILIKSQDKDQGIEYLQHIDFPFVVIGRPEESSKNLWVDNDNIGVTYNLVSRMIEDGHKVIGFIGGEQQWAVSRERFEGYRKALTDHGINYEVDLVYHGDKFDKVTGEEGIKVLSQNDKLTAIIATDDMIAIGVNDYFIRNNINNISLVGINNTILAEYQNPPLASIDINAGKLGYYASKLLMEALKNNKQEKQYHIIETEFIERESYKTKK